MEEKLQSEDKSQEAVITPSGVLVDRETVDPWGSALRMKG